MNHKQQRQVKSSVKLNMIESVLMNVDEKVAVITPKKKGIVESDMKMFNFLLQCSSEDQNQQQQVLKQRDCEMERPYLSENEGEFHFIKKKKSIQYKPEEVRNEFQKLIMDQSVDEEEWPTTPFLGNQCFYKIMPNNVEKEPIQVQHFKLMKQPEKEPSKNYVFHSTFRKTTEQKEKYTKIFNNQSKKELAISAYSGQTHCISNKEMSTDIWTEITNCGCRKTRIQRNFITSKVVEVAFAPNNKYKVSHLSSLTLPKFMSSYKFNDQIGREYVVLPKNRSKQQENNFENKKPAFLNTLKKRKEQNSQKQEFSKQKANQSLQFERSIGKSISQRRFRHNKFKSCVQDLHNLNNQQTRSTPKLHESKSFKTIIMPENPQRVEKIENIEVSQAHYKKSWQMSSNCIQQVPEYKQISNIKTSQMSNLSMMQTSPLKFYPPLPIMTPNIYVNPIEKSQNQNKIVINVLDQRGKLQINPQMSYNLSDQMTTQNLFKGFAMRSPPNLRQSPLGFSAQASKRFI